VHEVRGVILAVALIASGCGGRAMPRATPVTEEKPAPKKKKKKVAAATKPGAGTVLHGHAVWYGSDWHGKPTASGERFNKRKLTAAHRTLPFGTIVRVTNERNGKSVLVRINDRGPFGKDKRRIIDLSEAAARKLDFIGAGWAPVAIEVVEMPR